MRILLAHNCYQFDGGEDAVVANERSLLEEHGHNVKLSLLDNDEIVGAWRKIRTAWQVSYSKSSRTKQAKTIAEYEPDIVHVHNFFPLLTPAIYDACRDAGVPVVQTLHNYRTICAGALLMREGRLCEDCIGASPYQAVLHRCYRGSYLGSLAVARMVDTHRMKGTWHNKVDSFIALTDFARTKFIEAGFPNKKITVKPNFVEDRQLVVTEGNNRNGALFVGRLSSEKGVHTLLRAWENLDVQLNIVGTGPLMNDVNEARSAIIAALGRKESGEVVVEMVNAAFLVIPSEWYEGFPMTLVEAFCQGLPVIASRLGAMAEIVEDGVTGLHFTPGDAEDLAAKVRWAVEHPKEMRQMGAKARRVYEEKYTQEANYRQLEAIYIDAMKNS